MTAIKSRFGGSLFAPNYLEELRVIDIMLTMDDEYPKLLGKLVGNLQALEFTLRSFLVNDEIQSGSSFPESAHLENLEEGDEVILNAFTNYDNLSQLIAKYNENGRISRVGLRIDDTVVDIRDAIAHGRVSSPTPSGNPKLLKFSKPEHNENHVKVTFSVTLTKEWLGVQIRQGRDAVLTVREANERLEDGRL